jgi:hypothetical protein
VLKRELESVRANAPTHEEISKLQNTILQMETERYRLRKESEDSRNAVSDLSG